MIAMRAIIALSLLLAGVFLVWAFTGEDEASRPIPAPVPRAEQAASQPLPELPPQEEQLPAPTPSPEAAPESAALPATVNSSDDELRRLDLAAQERLQEKELQRNEMRAEIEAKTLSELIVSAQHLAPPMSINLITFSGDPTSPDAVYNSFAEDLRIDHLITSALEGDEQTRAEMLATVTEVVSAMLTECQRRAAGEAYDPEVAKTMQGAMVYPMLLGILDEQGESLPLLLDWYALEAATPTVSAEDLLASDHIPVEVRAMLPTDAHFQYHSPAMSVIAGAVLAIGERTGQVERPAPHVYDPESGVGITADGRAFDPYDPLAPTGIIPNVSILESRAIMQQLAETMQAP